MTQRGLAAYQAAKAAGIGRLSGTVLEIGAGRGRNFTDLRPGVRWIGAEPDARRRTDLAGVARGYGHREPPLDAPAEALPLPGASVDGVLSTGVLCSVRDQDRALAEIARVLRPGGIFVFAEHVAAPPGWKRRLQKVAAPVTRTLDHGCDPVRETEAAVRRSALTVVRVDTFDLPALPGLTMPYIVGHAVLDCATR
jgi:SAM-dependent methyltransferase